MPEERSWQIKDSGDYNEVCSTFKHLTEIKDKDWLHKKKLLKNLNKNRDRLDLAILEYADYVRTAI